MEIEQMGAITLLLKDWRQGQDEALGQLIENAYKELTRIGTSLMRQEAPNHSLQPQSLVHEAYLRIQSLQSIDWQNRNHFYSMCAKVMRRVLIDHARADCADKRGGREIPVTLDYDVSQQQTDTNVVDLIDALECLEKEHFLLSRIVNLRYFLGLSIEETASALHLSPASVKRKWSMARAWLYRELYENH